MTPRFLGVAGCVLALAATAACTSDDSIDSARPDGTAVAAADPDAVLVVGLGLPRDDVGLT